jgi:hypothetical protein
MADDIERWLADEPVLAHPDPFSVRLRRWGLRHRTAVARPAGVTAAPGIARDGGAQALGYSPPILSQGTWAGIQAGLPYAMSNLIAYANVDLLKRAADWIRSAQAPVIVAGGGVHATPVTRCDTWSRKALAVIG